MEINVGFLFLSVDKKKHTVKVEIVFLHCKYHTSGSCGSSPFDLANFSKYCLRNDFSLHFAAHKINH